ncbi:MAG: hypothetical protein LBG48_02090, partial [Rickettsiales bacterium]|nr:hypothetical protein [Rickettsiales bacterium]
NGYGVEVDAEEAKKYFEMLVQTECGNELKRVARIEIAKINRVMEYKREYEAGNEDAGAKYLECLASSASQKRSIEAIESLKMMAIAGNAEAQFRCYKVFKSQGTIGDCLAVPEYLEMAVAQGHREACLEYTNIMMFEECKKNLEKIALERISELADGGDAEAQFRRGECILGYLLTVEDLKEAKSYFQMVLSAEGQDKLKKEASRKIRKINEMEKYKRMEDSGDRVAGYKYYELCRKMRCFNANKKDITRDDLERVRQAVEVGHTEALLEYAKILEKISTFLEFDTREMISYLEEAAQLYHEASVAYEKERNTEMAKFAKNTSEAIYEKFKLLNKGFLTVEGLRIDAGIKIIDSFDRNKETAARHFRAAAEDGDVLGRICYGLCLVSGYGVEKNMEEGFRYLDSHEDKINENMIEQSEKEIKLYQKNQELHYRLREQRRCRWKRYVQAAFIFEYYKEAQQLRENPGYYPDINLINQYKFLADEGSELAQVRYGLYLLDMDDYRGAFKYFHLAKMQGNPQAGVYEGDCFKSMSEKYRESDVDLYRKIINDILSDVMEMDNKYDSVLNQTLRASTMLSIRDCFERLHDPGFDEGERKKGIESVAALSYKTASEYGNEEGLFKYAECLETGVGVDEDILEAANLYKFASGRGVEEAGARLNNLCTNRGIDRNRLRRKTCSLRTDKVRNENGFMKLIYKSLSEVNDEIARLSDSEQKLPKLV